MTWIQTRGGDAFELLSPKPGMIHFEEIATILSRIPRFNGHTGDVFSVAQHCTEGAKAILRSGVEDATALAFLLHDAHEAFLASISTEGESPNGWFAYLILVTQEFNSMCYTKQ